MQRGRKSFEYRIYFDSLSIDFKIFFQSSKMKSWFNYWIKSFLKKKKKASKRAYGWIMDLYEWYIQFLIFLRKEARKEEFRLAQNIFQQFGCRSRFKIPFTIFFQSSKTVQLSWIESFFKQKRRELLNTSLGWIIWIYTNDIYNF